MNPSENGGGEWDVMDEPTMTITTSSQPTEHASDLREPKFPPMMNGVVEPSSSAVNLSMEADNDAESGQSQSEHEGGGGEQATSQMTAEKTPSVAGRGVRGKKRKSEPGNQRMPSGFMARLCLAILQKHSEGRPLTYPEIYAEIQRRQNAIPIPIKLGHIESTMQSYFSGRYKGLGECFEKVDRGSVRATAAAPEVGTVDDVILHFFGGQNALSADGEGGGAASVSLGSAAATTSTTVAAATEEKSAKKARLSIKGRGRRRTSALLGSHEQPETKLRPRGGKPTHQMTPVSGGGPSRPIPPPIVPHPPVQEPSRREMPQEELEGFLSAIGVPGSLQTPSAQILVTHGIVTEDMLLEIAKLEFIDPASGLIPLVLATRIALARWARNRLNATVGGGGGGVNFFQNSTTPSPAMFATPPVARVGSSGSGGQQALAVGVSGGSGGRASPPHRDESVDLEADAQLAMALDQMEDLVSERSYHLTDGESESDIPIEEEEGEESDNVKMEEKESTTAASKKSKQQKMPSGFMQRLCLAALQNSSRGTDPLSFSEINDEIQRYRLPIEITVKHIQNCFGKYFGGHFRALNNAFLKTEDAKVSVHPDSEKVGTVEDVVRAFFPDHRVVQPPPSRAAAGSTVTARGGGGGGGRALRNGSKTGASEEDHDGSAALLVELKATDHAKALTALLSTADATTEATTSSTSPAPPLPLPPLETPPLPIATTATTKKSPLKSKDQTQIEKEKGGEKGETQAPTSGKKGGGRTTRASSAAAAAAAASNNTSEPNATPPEKEKEKRGSSSKKDKEREKEKEKEDVMEIVCVDGEGAGAAGSDQEEFSSEHRKKMPPGFMGALVQCILHLQGGGPMTMTEIVDEIQKHKVPTAVTYKHVSNALSRVLDHEAKPGHERLFERVGPGKIKLPSNASPPECTQVKEVVEKYFSAYRQESWKSLVERVLKESARPMTVDEVTTRARELASSDSKTSLSEKEFRSKIQNGIYRGSQANVNQFVRDGNVVQLTESRKAALAAGNASETPSLPTEETPQKENENENEKSVEESVELVQTDAAAASTQTAAKKERPATCADCIIQLMKETKGPMSVEEILTAFSTNGYTFSKCTVKKNLMNRKGHFCKESDGKFFMSARTLKKLDGDHTTEEAEAEGSMDGDAEEVEGERESKMEEEEEESSQSQEENTSE